jgi:hypothetical protein
MALNAEWFVQMWERLLDALKGVGNEELEEQAKQIIRDVLGPIAEHGLPSEQEAQLKEMLRAKAGPLAHLFTEASDEIARMVGKLAMEAALAAAEQINPHD